jgi:hypothetical protein
VKLLATYRVRKSDSWDEKGEKRAAFLQKKTKTCIKFQSSFCLICRSGAHARMGQRPMVGAPDGATK